MIVGYLKILNKSPENNSLDFGELFNGCLKYFKGIGCYSPESSSGVLLEEIKMNFCNTVKGTMYGNYSLALPIEKDRHGCDTNINVFFHFSTLAEENLFNNKEVLSIGFTHDNSVLLSTLLNGVATSMSNQDHNYYVHFSDSIDLFKVEVKQHRLVELHKTKIEGEVA